MIRRAASLMSLSAVLVLLATGCSSSRAASSPGSAARSPSASPATSASTAADTLDAADQATIDKLAQASLFNGITGVIVGIDDPAKGHLVKAYGAADASGRPISADMHYRIASVSKTFTAWEILHLSEVGTVSLSDPVSKYVSGVPNGGTVTLRQLLAMRSGLFDFTGDTAFADAYSANPTIGFSLPDLLKIVNANPNTPPDRVTQYDNTNYWLLGEVIAKATGRPLPDVLDDAAKTFGLAQTSYPAGDTLPAPYLSGYILDNPPADGHSPVADPRTRAATDSNPEVPAGAGALVSTVPDMLHYAEELGTGAHLSAATFQQRQAFTPLQGTNGQASYGLGLTKLFQWIGHDGSIVGYSDMVFYLPSAKASLVVAVNEANGERVPSQLLWGEIVKALYPGTIG